MYWNPDLVRLDLAQAHKLDTPKEFPQSMRALSYDLVGFEEGEFEIPMEMTDVTTIGTLGDPAQARAEKGRIMAEAVSDYYCRAIREIQKIPVFVKNREFTQRV